MAPRGMMGFRHRPWRRRQRCIEQLKMTSAQVPQPSANAEKSCLAASKRLCELQGRRFRSGCEQRALLSLRGGFKS